MVHMNPLGPLLAALFGVYALQTILGVFRDTPVSVRASNLVMRAVVVVAALDFVVWIARFFGALGGPVPV
jgi:hypothetical protein